MFERYTEAARRTLFFARYEASRFGNLSIEAEHLLLGVIHDRPNSVMAELLARADVSPARIRADVEGVMVVTQEKVSTSVEIPFSRDTKEILNLAASEADDLQSHAIDNEHLLLGILRSEHTQVASILNGLGLRLGEARQEIVRLRKEDAKSHQARAARVTRGETQVRIVPTRRTDVGISIRGLPGTLHMDGFTVRAALSRVCGVPESRIEMVAPIDENQRYDLSAVWSPNERRRGGEDLIREGIKHHFKIAIAYEGRWMEVYVLSAPNGTSASMTEILDLGDGGIGFSGVEFMATRSLDEPRLDSGGVVTNLSASNATMDEFCHTLETALDRLVVDETHLEGRFDVRVEGHATTFDEVRGLLLAQTQLVLSPAMRQVSMLIVRQS